MIIGLDVGGTKTAVVSGSAKAEILQREEILTQAHRPFAETFPRICRIISRLGLESSVDAISVSVGGPLRIGAGELIDPPHLPGWHGVPLKRELETAFPGIPVFVEHDGNAGALAEFHFGIGRGREDLRHLVFLTFGTGMGAGFIVNGRVVHGVTDTAGEIGHWRLADHGPSGFGKSGSFEGFASGEGLVRLATRRNGRRWPPETSIRSLVEDMLSDEAEALEVAAEAGRWLGRGLALLVDALNPQAIVLGSLAVVLGERVLASAREVVAAEALPQATAACTIAPAALGNRIGDVASLMAAIAARA